MKIFFIRHAESINNYFWYHNRANADRLPDPGLSDLGEQQAKALRAFLAAHLHEFNFTRIYVSPFLRTLLTLQAFEDLYDVPKTVWRPLHETGGCFASDDESGERRGMPGMGRRQIEALFPSFSVSSEISDDGWWGRDEDEPRHERVMRGNMVLDLMAAQYGSSQERIALVSHGDFHNSFLRALIGIARGKHFWFEIENTGITCLTTGPERGEGLPQDEWGIDYVNRCEWLNNGMRRRW